MQAVFFTVLLSAVSIFVSAEYPPLLDIHEMKCIKAGLWNSFKISQNQQEEILKRIAIPPDNK